MFTYNCLNPIANIGLEKFDDQYKMVEQINEAQSILVRSAVMHDMEFSETLVAIARAGAGVNNIPLEKAADQGIVVFNTPGANANGVKELVIAGMLMASRDVIGGINWVEEHKEDATIAKDAEKAKNDFAGHELQGKRLGVIGLGAIGVLVANVATHLGMEVFGYDPYISVGSAWNLSRSIKHIENVEDIYKECDYISIHVPAMDNTIGMINQKTLAMMKKEVVILNFARDILVDASGITEALEAGKVGKYVTDFPVPGLASVKNTIVIPHLGASTEESEDNCAKMAVDQIKDYMENGNIKNSVNYPNCDMGNRTKEERITVAHKNIPNMIGQFTTLLANAGVNISNMMNKSRGDYAYTMLDVQSEGDLADVVAKLKTVEGVLKVRQL